jgi:PST family polysaccharide transporter
LGNRELIGILYVLSFVPILKGMSNPYFILYERDLSFKRESLRLVLSSLGGSLVGIVLAVLFRTYWALVGGVVVSTALSTVLSYWRVSGIPRFSLAKTAELLSFGGWLLLIRVIDYLNGRLDYLLIGRSFGSGKLGSYHIGQQTILIATGDVIGPISRAIFPAFSMISSDPERLRWSYRKTQSVLLALTLPIGFCVSVLAQDIVLFLVGRKWMDAVPVIELLAPIIALHALLAGVEGVALTTGQTRALLWRTTLFFVVRASLLVVGFNLGGFLGIVYARVASGLFFLVYGLGLAARITGSRFSEPLLDGWRSFASVGIMAAALATLPPASPAAALPHVGLLLGAKIAMGGALYAATHILLWLASGRPTGAETRLIEQTAHMIRALRASVGRTPQE